MVESGQEVWWHCSYAVTQSQDSTASNSKANPPGKALKDWIRFPKRVHFPVQVLTLQSSPQCPNAV